MNEKKTEKRFSPLRVSLLLFVFFVIVGIKAYEEPIWFMLSERKAESNDFYAAYSVACRAESEECARLRSYISLRIEINNGYPELLTDFNIKTLEKWRDEAAEVAKYSNIFSKKISESSMRLSETLELLCTLYNDYNMLENDIFSVMDVFFELNRLYTDAGNGGNTAFTVDEENEKIENWLLLNEKISGVAYSIPGHENLYLLNYLIKEVRSECEDLSTAMRMVLENGYSSSDNVHLSGEAVKIFPDIQSNTNQKVNLQRKDEYIKAMYSGVCRALLQNIAEYYTVGLEN